MSFNSLYGMNIYVDDETMSDVVEDWSNVRSPGRARRRLKRNFRQNIRMKKVPKKEVYKFDGKLIMHSQMVELLKESIKDVESKNYRSSNHLSF